MSNNYHADQIKNIVLMGHQGVGKTSLIEGMLYANKQLQNKGKISSMNTTSDFTKEEKDAQLSIYSSVCPILRPDCKINLLDTPGFMDFVGEVLAPLSVASCAAIVVRGSKGVEVGTKRAIKFVKDRKLPCVVIVTRFDRDRADHERVLRTVQEAFAGKAVAINMPDHDGLQFTSVIDKMEPGTEEFAALTEKVASCDDTLMEKFLMEEEITPLEVKEGLKKAIACREVVPVMFTSYEKMIGVQEALNFLAEYAPATDTMEFIDESKPFSAFVYKTNIDPFVGRMNYIQVKTGILKNNAEIYNSSKQQKDKISAVSYPLGSSLTPATEVVAGDIAVISKSNSLDTNDTICDMNAEVNYMPIAFPQPTVYYGIVVANKNDEAKVGEGLKRSETEDKTISVQRNVETKQLVVGCQGQNHIDAILTKIKNNFKCQTTTEDAKVPYRETIKGFADVEGKHKKQSGGAGQYGHVKVKFEPSEKEFEFVNAVFGGSVPTNFIPAVEKGLQEACKTGILTGNPVVNIRCTLYDGSSHAVDSNELSFKLAASLAFKAGMKQAKPVLLEPILKVKITTPNEFVGDVMSNISKNRGMVGEISVHEDTQIIECELPQIEFSKCALDLKTLTQAQTEITHEFLRYAEVPRDAAEKIIADYQKAQASE